MHGAQNTLIAQNDADFAQKLQKLIENHDISAQIAQNAKKDIQTQLKSIPFDAILSKFL